TLDALCGGPDVVDRHQGHQRCALRLSTTTSLPLPGTMKSCSSWTSEPGTMSWSSAYFTSTSCGSPRSPDRSGTAPERSDRTHSSDTSNRTSRAPAPPLVALLRNSSARSGEPKLRRMFAPDATVTLPAVSTV